MTRSFLIILIILFLASCHPQLVVRQINTGNIQIDEISGGIDSAVLALVKPYGDSIAADMSKLVTISATPLIKNKPESKLTNLVADVMLEAGAKYCAGAKLKINPDASYVNYGGLRASLPQGEITVGRIFELMPFENEIVLIKISGEALIQMGQRIAARGGEGVAGMKMGIRNEKPETFLIHGKVADPAGAYWLVTNDYIANGGDQMSMFANPLERINTCLKIRDVLIQTLSNRYKKNGILDVKEDGRIYHEQ